MAAPCSGADLGLRRAAAAEGRRWIGTPYCHQASVKGAGADCLGLLRGVWRATLGDEPEPPPPYSADWSEASGDERLLAAAMRHLVPIDPRQAGIGDVLLFRMRESAPAKHVGLLVSEALDQGRIIHAYSGHRVCETHLTASWLRKLAATFRFPERGH
ncbi:MAG: C40 family peptidase [Proteobacteria bacterium]|nr:C40 family peptidase [Pseudomonadota bacterium]